VECLKCGCYFPIKITIEGIKRNLGNRKFCLACSPFKRHNTKNLLINKLDIQKCSSCKVVLISHNSYKRKNRKDKFAYCKSCVSKKIVEKNRKFKLECVKYKGGECEKCGYKKYAGALEFHHRDEKEKDIKVFRRLRSTKLNDILKNELDKCDILCVNCHREMHFEKEIINKNIISGRKLKKECVMYKGGECEKCKYKKCFGALEFHHRNPKEKDFSICKKYGCKKMSNRIKKELDKCEILCGNCHREEHQKIREVGLEPTTPAL
jgi:hypothetical protein